MGRVHRFFSLVFVLSAVPGLGSSIEMPSVADLNRSIAEDSYRLSDPQLGLGELFYELSDEERSIQRKGMAYERWHLQSTVATQTLIEGNVQLFNDRLRELIADVDLSVPKYAVSVARALHLATEAGVLPDIDVFRRAAEGVSVAHRESLGVDDVQYTLYMASYYFASGQAARLEELAQRSVDGSADSLFATGYTYLLVAKLTQQSSAAEMAIEMLGRSRDLLGSTNELTGPSIEGRIELQLADAYRFLAQRDNDLGQRRDYVNAAVKEARLARQHIELLDFPILWGAAHRVTSEVLDLLYRDVEDPQLKSRLIALRDRAYELSLSYQ